MYVFSQFLKVVQVNIMGQEILWHMVKHIYDGGTGNKTIYLQNSIFSEFFNSKNLSIGISYKYLMSEKLEYHKQ